MNSSELIRLLVNRCGPEDYRELWYVKSFVIFNYIISIPNKCPEYDTKQSDGEAPVLELWRMWSTPSLLLLLGPL